MSHVKDYLDNRDETRMAFAHYYLSFPLRDVVGFDNRVPHCLNHAITPFYKNCIQLFRKHKDIVNTLEKKHYYDKLNEVSKERETELRKQLSRLTQHDNRKHIFKLLHCKTTTPKQKQITYRLLYGVTATTYYKHRKTGRHFPCAMCGEIQESENHIFWECQTKLRETLIREFRLPINTRHRHVVHTAVFLNLFPFSNLLEKNYRNMLVGTYREIIWHARNDAHHNNKHTTPEQLKARFLGKITHACKRYFSREDMERINKLNESQYERLRESDSESVKSTTSLTSMIVMFNESSSIGSDNASATTSPCSRPSCTNSSVSSSRESCSSSSSGSTDSTFSTTPSAIGDSSSNHSWFPELGSFSDSGAAGTGSTSGSTSNGSTTSRSSYFSIEI